MNLLDVRERGGYYWQEYQDYRARNGVVEDPDLVPTWFLRKLMTARLAEARVAMERQAHRSPGPRMLSRCAEQELLRVYRALRTVQEFVDLSLADERDVVLAALLGAAEVESARASRG